MTLYIDQHGQRYYAKTVKDLRSQIGNGGSKVSKMFGDGEDGKTYHVGYFIGGHWLEGFTPMRKETNL